MKKVVLLCAGGMSTSLLVAKIEEAAKLQGIECQVSAHPVSTAKEVGKDADIILLGPQIKYELNNIKKTLPNKQIQVIDMVDYGMMDGKSIVKKIVNYLK